GAPTDAMAGCIPFPARFLDDSEAVPGFPYTESHLQTPADMHRLWERQIPSSFHVQHTKQPVHPQCLRSYLRPAFWFYAIRCRPVYSNAVSLRPMTHTSEPDLI